MRFTYLCPHCHAHLNPREDTIALMATREGQRGLVMFDSTPGSYEVHSPQGLQINEGDIWVFSCPVCAEELTVPHNRTLARITLHAPLGEHAVVFSRIAGEKATFVANAEGALEAYGEHRSLYERLPWLKLFG